MSNTYSQMYAHCVWAVKRRKPLIPRDKREELEKYITEIISRRGQKLIAIYCMPDHIHVLIGFRPNICISDVIRDVKRVSSSLINEKFWAGCKFEWQEGFGCFTCSNHGLPRIIKYIQNQEQHHKKNRFEDEYLNFMKEHQIDFNKEYVFG